MDFIEWANLTKHVYRANRLFEDFNDCLNRGQEYRTHDLIQLIDKYTIDDKDQRFYKVIRKGTKVYRARVVKNFDYENYYDFDAGSQYVRGYNEINSREAPIGKSPSGRNNIEGVSYLYVSKDEKTACAELKSSPMDLISLATFELTQNMKIVDFAFDKRFKEKEIEDDQLALGLLFTRIMKSYITPVRNKEEDKTYKITQIISDHIRKMGVDGISYGSFYDRQGENYTFFNSHKKFFTFCGSRLLVNKSERVSFLDFENESILNVYSRNDTKYDKNSADDMMKNIKYTIINQAKGDKEV